MAGTRAGGLKARDKNLAKDPKFYSNIGRKGGLVQVPKGFAISGKAVEAGSLGGKNRTGWRKHKTPQES